MLHHQGSLFHFKPHLVARALTVTSLGRAVYFSKVRAIAPFCPFTVKQCMFKYVIFTNLSVLPNICYKITETRMKVLYKYPRLD